MPASSAVMDGNEAAAHVAYRASEVIAIYPITPASPMGELSDAWSTAERPNLWGSVPRVIEMQAEGGAAGAVHGSLQAGALTTTFTASQGLLLMIPNMYKVAGELTPAVFHIAARSIAAQALSIFGDHSDVMAARGTGWGMLFSASVQESMDMAAVAHAATLKCRIPFLHVFDGFRTSHELQKIEVLPDDTIRSLMDEEAIRDFRARAMSPDRPTIRGTAQNPDVFFQARESVNPRYEDALQAIKEAMTALGKKTGREYGLVDYVGHPEATRVVVLMGSGLGAAEEAVRKMSAEGERVGLLKLRLFRPFPTDALLDALPSTVERIAVLDRTKEPGCVGEPLYQDIITTVAERGVHGRRDVQVIGGRFGLSSKEFTPAMVRGVFENLGAETPKNHFTVGIVDDVSNTHIDFDESFSTESDDVTRAVFWGLGSDGTVGANKNSIKIIGESLDGYAQGYFVYDSKKSGARTVSHLRFGPEPITSTYLISEANFVAVHQWMFLDKYDTLAAAAPGATVLLNSPFGPEDVWDQLPAKVQATVLERNLKLWVIDAYKVARDLGLGPRINTLMQTCFFALSGVLEADKAKEEIKGSIRRTYGKRGEAVVNMNYAAVDAALDHLHEVSVGTDLTGAQAKEVVPERAPDFVQRVTAEIMAGRGDLLPVSALPDDGVYPTGTTKWEKRQIAQDIPIWNADLCIQCGKCVMVCPHTVIRSKVTDAASLEGKPEGFQDLPASWREFDDARYTIQVSADDCTGCQLCVEVCPARDKSNVSRKALEMAPMAEAAPAARAGWDFFTGLDEHHAENTDLKYTKTKDVQLLEPYFEFSGACAGCGETPYLSLLTRLVGDRLYVANATGCSSIYGGNLPTTPWSQDQAGRGPTWANSLFEDNAEFGFGMRVAVDKQRQYACELLDSLAPVVGKELAYDLSHPKDPAAAREHVEALKQVLAEHRDTRSRDLMALADLLVPKSVWIVGGDGWAYDIGFGGLDHVLASGQNINVLVLDTEVYSNTGGQASKATGLGAVAKFAAGGKPTPKKDLGLLAMSYGYVYVAQIAMGADENQAIRAFREAEAHDGPSLIIAYSQCIAHGIDMAKGMDQSDRAVKSGHWPLFRFDPARQEKGLPPLQLDSKAPSLPLRDYFYRENRYRVLKLTNPEAAAGFLRQAEDGIKHRYEQLVNMATPPAGDGAAGSGPPSGPGTRKPPGGMRKPPPGMRKPPPGKRPPSSDNS
ncbi:MAG: pyruvate:ferredoxin (flavodoxin) oxidoreductase [Rhodothermales bacterium]|nr:pyruvate:ferredoxin (flavodoxin) oxidoreductase [Rhodothermales bacterium]